MSTTNLTAPDLAEPGVLLDRDQVDQLCRLLGTVEDWLLHCVEEALDDLAGFLAGLAWAPLVPRERLVADLLTQLGEHAVTLHTALRRADVQTGPQR